MPSFYIEVAIPVPLHQRFDYLPQCTTEEAHQYCAGQRVRVEFGSRILTGVVIDTHVETQVPEDKLRPVLTRLDEQPTLTEDMIALCQWTAHYYHASLGMVYEIAIPAMLRRGANIEECYEAHWQRLFDSHTPIPKAIRSQKQKDLWNLFSSTECIPHRLLLDKGFTRAQLNRFATLDLIHEIEQLPQLPTTKNCASPLALNPEQTQALQSIRGTLSQFAVTLLEGVTGSGKTEVYLQLIQQCLDQGKQCLVLVPEIGLTPQTMQRFRQRFDTGIVMLHSGLNDRQRLQGWEHARRGEARIILGTRSAIFTPMPKLGLIIIDEEHDASFKQQDGVRYSARELAIMRARQLNCPVLLGSATPCLETLHNAFSRRYRYQRLTQRAGHAKPPAIALQSILHQPLTGGFNQHVLASIQQHLNRGQQVLVFLNRRGFAPILNCQDCGWMAECRHCSVRMTVHQNSRSLHCHHCDQKQSLPHVCPSCGGHNIDAFGQGTERVELQLNALFPETSVLRIDRDSIKTKQAFDELYDTILEGQPCLLVGTQMLAKGHHFPDVTLVVVLDSDQGLFSADFRGMEHAAQLIEQVSGRAGRANKPGTVYIQTLYPDHPQLTRLVNDGYHALAEEILQHRQQQQLPPFSYLALIRAECEDASKAEGILRIARRGILDFGSASHTNFKETSLNLVGPFPAVIERRQGRYRFVLQCFCESRKQLHQALDVVTQLLQKETKFRKVRWSIDVDPIDCM